MNVSRSRVVDHDGGRKADLAAIHIGKKALGWSESEYRDLLWTVCTVKSSAELDIAGRKRFLDHMRKCGFGKPTSHGQHRVPFTPTQAKIWSLWQSLADEKRVRDRTRPALEAYIARQTGVDKLDWLNTKQEELVIESLKRWLDRKDGPGNAA